MKSRPIALTAALLFAAALPALPTFAADQKPDTLKALLVTGGCCHDYDFQSKALIAGVDEHAKIDWTTVNEGGTGTRAQIALYDDPDWAKPYDVVVHNECFADTADESYIKKITDAHKAGVPAIVIHCAMHTYRAAKTDDWRMFLGVTSNHHEHQSKYPVKVVAQDHPSMKDMPEDWVTPMDELYVIEKLWPTAQALATSKSEKTGEEQPVVWVNKFGDARVFGTTYGHTNETFSDPVFLRMIANGILWATGPEE
ncbi:ThuA domain-containing protein [soil metagenome]